MSTTSIRSFVNKKQRCLARGNSSKMPACCAAECKNRTSGDNKQCSGTIQSLETPRVNGKKVKIFRNIPSQCESCINRKEKIFQKFELKTMAKNKDDLAIVR